jgi:hypothetical protein
MTARVRSTIVILAGLVAAPALSQESRYTDLVGPACKFLPRDPRPGDVKRCRGLGGASPETLAEHTRTQFGLRFDGAPAAPLLNAWSFGTRLEWRGRSGSAGFTPEAAILRVLLKDPDSAKPTADGQVLAVMRIDAPGRRACLMAVLDGSRPDANARAREVADRLGASFRCGADRPSTAGDATPWTKAVLESLP